MDFIIEGYNSLASLGKESPVIAGLIGVWMAACLTWLLRSVPMKIWDFIKNQSITSLSIYDQAWSSNSKLFGNFQDWVESLKGFKISRAYTVASTLSSSKVVPGLGLHIFTYKKRLFWFSIEEMDSSGSEKVKRKLVLKTFGRNKDVLNEVLKEFKDFDEKYSKYSTGTYILKKDMYWDRASDASPRNFDSVFLNSGTKEELTGILDKYLESREFYTKAGLPYRTSIMLHGVPGTGKTSIIKAMGNYLNRKIYILPLELLSGAGLISALTQAKGGMVVIEDVDGCDVIHKRSSGNSSEPKNIAEIFSEKGSGIHEVLNSFDGVIEVSDIIIVMTTNHLDKIDPAFLRPGRTDHILEIKPLNREAIHDAIQKLFSVEFSESEIKINTISGANLTKVYKDCYPNKDEAIKQINLLGE